VKLSDNERRIALWIAGAAALLSIGLWSPQFDRPAGVVIALVGVVMAGLLALAARSRSRLLTGGASLLLAFGPWGFVWVLGAPFLLFAVWTWFGSRRQPVAGEAGVEAPEAARPAKAVAPPKPTGPPRPSKRYTPPKP
jgi:hypothetical protein